MHFSKCFKKFFALLSVALSEVLWKGRAYWSVSPSKELADIKSLLICFYLWLKP